MEEAKEDTSQKYESQKDSKKSHEIITIKILVVPFNGQQTFCILTNILGARLTEYIVLHTSPFFISHLVDTKIVPF